MAHLLADMSVPTHAHNNQHGAPTDKYEDKMKISRDDESFINTWVNYWDADRVWNKFKNIMYPYVYYDTPLHHLMYTVNQIADHFASNSVPGDDNYNDMHRNKELVDYFPNGILPTTINEYQNCSETDLINIRDATFPHAIRATTGLLYWFAEETGLISHIDVTTNYGVPLIKIDGVEQISGSMLNTVGNQN